MQSVVPVHHARSRRRPAGLARLVILATAALLLLGATSWLVPPGKATAGEGPRAAPFRWVTIARGVV